MIKNTQSIIRDMIGSVLKIPSNVVNHPFEQCIFPNDAINRSLLGPLKENVYRFLLETEEQGGFRPGCSYCFKTSLDFSLMIVPSREPADYLVIGPYFTEDFSDRTFSHICIAHQIPSSMTAAWRALCTTLPVVPQSQLERACDVAARYLSGCQEVSRKTLVLKLDRVFSAKSGPTESFQLASGVLEERYQKENHLLGTIRRGDEKTALGIVKGWNEPNILPRPKDAVRGRKDIMLSLNTLIRKTVEQCDVHPFYLDQLSRKKAMEIENSMTMGQLDSILENMVEDYCRLVRTYSLSRFSRPVQRAMNYITLNLTQNLSLNIVAAQVELAPAYFGNLFKKEYKRPVTSYIHEKRIEHAAILLRRSLIPVSEVAARSGFLDASYFTYLFRRAMGMTPTVYRMKYRGYSRE